MTGKHQKGRVLGLVVPRAESHAAMEQKSKAS